MHKHINIIERTQAMNPNEITLSEEQQEFIKKGEI